MLSVTFLLPTSGFSQAGSSRRCVSCYHLFTSFISQKSSRSNLCHHHCRHMSSKQQLWSPAMLSPFLVTQQAAAVCYLSPKKHPPLPNVPNPKCANCAGAKSAKARFEFLRLACRGWYRVCAEPNCPTCHSRRNEPDMSQSPILIQIYTNMQIQI